MVNYEDLSEQAQQQVQAIVSGKGLGTKAGYAEALEFVNADAALRNASVGGGPTGFTPSSYGKFDPTQNMSYVNTTPVPTIRGKTPTELRLQQSLPANLRNKSPEQVEAATNKQLSIQQYGQAGVLDKQVTRSREERIIQKLEAAGLPTTPQYIEAYKKEANPFTSSRLGLFALTGSKPQAYYVDESGRRVYLPQGSAPPQPDPNVLELASLGFGSSPLAVGPKVGVAVPETRFIATVERTGKGSKVNVLGANLEGGEASSFLVGKQFIADVEDSSKSFGLGRGFNFQLKRESFGKPKFTNVQKFGVVSEMNELGGAFKAADPLVLKDTGLSSLRRTEPLGQGSSILSKVKIGKEKPFTDRELFISKRFKSGEGQPDYFGILGGGDQSVRINKVTGKVSNIIRKPNIRGFIFDVSKDLDEIGLLSSKGNTNLLSSKERQAILSISSAAQKVAKKAAATKALNTKIGGIKYDSLLGGASLLGINRNSNNNFLNEIFSPPNRRRRGTEGGGEIRKRETDKNVQGLGGTVQSGTSSGNNLLLGQTLDLFSSTKQEPVQLFTPTQDFSPNSNSRTLQLLFSEQGSRQELANPQINLLKNIFQTPKIPRIPKTESKLEKVKKKAMNILKEKGFYGEVKDKGKWLRTNKKPLTMDQARAIAAKVVDNTTAVSLRLIDAKKKPIKSNQSSSTPLFKFRDYSIRGKSRTKLPNFGLIEKKGSRIDSIGEKNQLSAAKYLKSGGFFGFGKRRKKRR